VLLAWAWPRALPTRIDLVLMLFCRILIGSSSPLSFLTKYIADPIEQTAGHYRLLLGSFMHPSRPDVWVRAFHCGAPFPCAVALAVTAVHGRAGSAHFGNEHARPALTVIVAPLSSPQLMSNLRHGGWIGLCAPTPELAWLLSARITNTYPAAAIMAALFAAGGRYPLACLWKSLWISA